MEISIETIMSAIGLIFGGSGIGALIGWRYQKKKAKADRIAAYWSSSKRSIECELLSNGSIGVDVTASSISPLSMVVIDGTTLYPYSIGHDYWKDVVKLVSIEM
jgi:predicted permease